MKFTLIIWNFEAISHCKPRRGVWNCPELQTMRFWQNCKHQEEKIRISLLPFWTLNTLNSPKLEPTMVENITIFHFLLMDSQSWNYCWWCLELETNLRENFTISENAPIRVPILHLLTVFRRPFSIVSEEILKCDLATWRFQPGELIVIALWDFDEGSLGALAELVRITGTLGASSLGNITEMKWVLVACRRLNRKTGWFLVGKYCYQLKTFTKET